MLRLFCKCCLLSIALVITLIYFCSPQLQTFLISKLNPRTQGIIPFVTPQPTWNYTLRQIPPQHGTVVIVTGANTGLGYSSSKILASKGATVILACRSSVKCATAVTSIQHLYPQADVTPMALDLSSLASVRSFAQTFQKQYPAGLDTLLLNAGVMMCPYTLTKDNIELQFGVNHVAHHYLTKLLLPSLHLKAEQGKMTHVVSVSSSASFNAYNNEPDVIKLTLKEINDPVHYNMAKAYGQSKLSNILFAKELQEQELQAGYTQMIVTAVHPGAVQTDLGRHIVNMFPSFLQSTIASLPSAIAHLGLMWKPDDAALSQLFAMSSPDLQLHPTAYQGKFLVPIATTSEPPVHAYNKTLQKQLWAFTELLILEKGHATSVAADAAATPNSKSTASTTTTTTTTTSSTTTTTTSIPPSAPTLATAIFAAGCFWSIELAFQRLPGVTSTSVGYVGGFTKSKATYEQVSRGTTGHAEAVQLMYDPSEITYNELLTVFFEIHDATQLNRQGGDVGTQYRSLIVADTKEDYIQVQQRMQHDYTNAVTEVLLSSSAKLNTKWWQGEDYHQQYLEKGGQSSEKGNLSPIQCYGNRGPLKHLQKKRKIVELFENRGVVDREEKVGVQNEL